MNIFEFSIKMERDAEDLYRKMADNTPVAGVMKVLLLLAEDEVKHRIAIEQFQKEIAVDTAQGSALAIKTVFEEMKSDKSIMSLTTDAIQDYEKAVEIEKKGLAFYKERFAEAEDDVSKKLFEVLMNQESYHLHTTQNLLDMIQRPSWWVENAEFNPQDNNSY